MFKGKCYRLVDVGVRKFGANKHLSCSKRSIKEGVNDLEEVNEDEVVGEEAEGGRRMVSGEISTVSTAEYHCCKLCHSKVEIRDDVLAECTKCSAVTKVTYCGKSD